MGAPAQASAGRLLAGPLNERKGGERKIKGRCKRNVLFSVSLSARLAFSKRNVRPEVCVLYSSTQIRLVPDLAGINNSLERCVCV